jgi:hypothetical protein
MTTYDQLALDPLVILAHIGDRDLDDRDLGSDAIDLGDNDGMIAYRPNSFGFSSKSFAEMESMRA